MTIEDAELERIDEKIRSLANANLATGRPYLLSRLGLDLGVDLNFIKIKCNKSLSDYVSNRLSSEYSIVLMGAQNNIKAIVVASDATIPFFQSKKRDFNDEKEARYNYRFWAAFSVPLLSGARWLNLDNLTFKDTEDKPDDSYIEVPLALVAPETVDNRDSVIKNNIEDWLKSNNLSREVFLAKSDKVKAKTQPISADNTLLEAVIGSLDRRQLASTTLSLDVVAELLRRRI